MSIYGSGFECCEDECEGCRRLLESCGCLHDKLAVAVTALEEIREIFAGSEIGIPVYASEAYAVRIVEEQYEVAVKAIKTIKNPPPAKAEG